jgi:hypothetical protein
MLPDFNVGSKIAEASRGRCSIPKGRLASAGPFGISISQFPAGRDLQRFFSLRRQSSDALGGEVKRRCRARGEMSQNVLTVMPFRQLGGLSCRHSPERVDEPGYIRIAIIIL